MTSTDFVVRDMTKDVSALGQLRTSMSVELVRLMDRDYSPRWLIGALS